MKKLLAIVVFTALLSEGANFPQNGKLSVHQSDAQSNLGSPKASAQGKTKQDTLTPATIFIELKQSIDDGNVKAVSKYIGTRVYLNLKDAESGYYSGNQAAYLIQNFFGTRRSLTFRFSTIKDTENSPYATGSGTFMARGGRAKLQVYVALSKKDGKWVITQFSVY